MTAYRSTLVYRADLDYRHGESVTVNGTVIAAATTIPTPVVTVNVAVSPAVIAATVSVPTPSVKINGSVTASLIAAVASVPTPSITGGAGVTVTPTGITGALTANAPTVTEGDGVSATGTAPAFGLIPTPDITQGFGVTATGRVRVKTTISTLPLAQKYIPEPEYVVPQIDVLPYYTTSPTRNLARFRRPGLRGRNIFILTDGTVTNRQPVNASLILRTLLGGHEPPPDLTDEEIQLLIDNGYSIEVSNA